MMKIKTNTETDTAVNEIAKFVKACSYTTAAVIMSKALLAFNEMHADKRFNINTLDLLQLDRENYNNLINVVNFLWSKRSVRAFELFDERTHSLMEKIAGC